MRFATLTICALLCSGIEALAQLPEDPVERMKHSAEQGDAQAQLAMGYYYSKQGDYKQAQEMLSKAAAQGHPQAIRTYGDWCVAEHLYAPALLYLTASAEDGNAEALFNLGMMFYKGWGVPRNPDEAQSFFAQAAEAGNRAADTMLAQMLLEGTVQEPDAEAAAEKLTELAEAAGEAASDRRPDYLLGLMLLRGVGTEENHQAAFVLISSAAENSDDSEIAYAMATLCERGLGTDKDAEKAATWLERVPLVVRARLKPLWDAYLSVEEVDARAALSDLLNSTTASDTNPAHKQMTETIMALPVYTIHEESRSDFRIRLEDGDFHEDDGKYYLRIGGDGSFGARVFISDLQGELYVVSENWENNSYDTYKYNPETKTLTLLFSLDKDMVSDE